MDYDEIFVGAKQLSSLKVKELQKELAKRALPTAGKKAELMERLAQVLNTPAPEEEMEVDDVQEQQAVAEPEQNTQPEEVEPGNEVNQEDQGMNDRFITPDREIEAPDASVRKSTTANRVRSAGKSALRPNAAHPYLSDDEDDAPLTEPSGTRSSRSSARRNDNLKTPARNDATGENKSSRRSAVALRTRSRSPQVDTPGNVLAGAVTPSRPRSATRTPRSALPGLPRIPPQGAGLPPATNGAGSAKATSTTRSARRTLATAIGACSAKKEVVGQKRAAPTPGKPPVPPKTSRFAEIHQKIYEKEETLGERQERLKKRHEELTGNVPSVVQRLHTPTRSPARQRTPGVSPARLPLRPQQTQGPRLEIANDLFKFGDVDPSDISKVQKQYPAGSSLIPGPSKPATEKNQKVDVKQRTKAGGIRPSSRNAPIVEHKAAGTPRQTPSRAGYTPKRGGLNQYIDTTKLTDYELQLAREERIIGGSIIKGAPPTTQNHKKRTQEILAIRRKLNMDI